jgi:hypothetical protein
MLAQRFTISFTFNEVMIFVCCFVLLLAATGFLRWLEKPLCPRLHGTLRCYRSQGHEGPHRTRDGLGGKNFYWDNEEDPSPPPRSTPQ